MCNNVPAPFTSMLIGWANRENSGARHVATHFALQKISGVGGTQTDHPCVLGLWPPA